MSRIVECYLEPTKVHVEESFKIKLKIQETKYHSLDDWKDKTMDEIKDMTLQELLVESE